MPDYLSRPIFEFAVDWSRNPSTRFDFDLRELQVGFGIVTFNPLQTYVAKGFTLRVWLLDAAELLSFQEFFEALYGRVQGFWIKAPEVYFRISDGVNGNRVDIEDQQLAETLGDHPNAHVRLEKAGETAKQTLINSVTDLGNGLERVTFADSVSVDETWTAYRLTYVRLRNPEIKGTFDGENRATVDLDVVELPTEYADAELGLRPVWFYQFQGNFGGSVVNWRFTSYWQEFEALGETWTPFPMSHGQLTQTTKADRESTTISAVRDGAHPLSLFVPFTLPVPLSVVIFKSTLADLTSVDVIFTGEIESVRPQGNLLVADVSSILDVMRRKVMRFNVGVRCNWFWADPNTCGVDRATYEETGTIDSITGRSVVVSDASLAGLGNDYFSEGWIEVGSGEEFEIRTIVKSEQTDTEEHTLTLNFPLHHAAVMDSITLLPGCDRTFPTCVGDYANGDRFGGHPHSPNRNPTVQAIAPSPGGGGKKG